jgi:hypothetical protein
VSYPFERLESLGHMGAAGSGQAGNVSAHTTHLVGSALSDPCLLLVDKNRTCSSVAFAGVAVVAGVDQRSIVAQSLRTVVRPPGIMPMLLGFAAWCSSQHSFRTCFGRAKRR